MHTYVEVAVNIPQISGVFHYHLDEELAGSIKPGHLVIVPFGKQTVQGVVLRAIEQPDVSETRGVLSLVDEDVALTQQQIQLALQLSEDTLSPLAACISLMIPAGLEQHADTLYSLASHPETDLKSGSTTYQLATLLGSRGPLRGRQIDTFLPKRDWRAAARYLVNRGLLTTRPMLSPATARPRLSRHVVLACTPAQAEDAMPNLSNANSKALARRQIMLRFLLQEHASAAQEPVEAAWLYAESGGSLADLKYLEKKGLIRHVEVETWRDPLSGPAPEQSRPFDLTKEQQKAWEPIERAMILARQGKSPAPLLLHGVTGSGKTELYLQAAAQTLSTGRQVIVMVPEIAMIPQIVQRFSSRFPGQVGLLHSKLSTGERYDTWRRARKGELGLIMGPRSALFAPLANLGLIVVDECHDTSYYNAEFPPFYNARMAAVTYARLCSAVCLLGSATPDLESRHMAEQGKWELINLPARILAHRAAISRQLSALEKQGSHTPGRFRPLEREAQAADLPPVRLVDMRVELKSGNRSIISRALAQALSETLERGEQAILFLNRRGTATYVFCRDCGYTLKCPHCDIPLAFHTHDHAGSPSAGKPTPLLCHRCNYTRQMPSICPDCRSPHIRQYGLGTERVESEIRQRHPQARVIRWDYDTTRKKDAHEMLFEMFSRHGADILIGTQMIAKGLDLPLVTLVGAILADVGLTLPDLRASERTFQVLTQVAGRAGRSPLGGQAILQTFQPDHYVLQAASEHSYDAFYKAEMAKRKKLDYPPFARLVRLEYRHQDQATAQAAAERLAIDVRTWLAQSGLRQTEIIGPAPCFFSRVAGQYRWQIILRGPNPVIVLRGQNLLEWRVEVDPISLL